MHVILAELEQTFAHENFLFEWRPINLLTPVRIGRVHTG